VYAGRGILHDPALYPDPFAFRPERFLNPEASKEVNLDPRRFAFGYGRRVCPGRDLAEDTLFICAAMVLAVFEVTRDKDAPPVEYTPAIIRWALLVHYASPGR
jgi:cytochrome P450